MEINSTYLEKKILEEMEIFFEEQGFIQLNNFLSQEFCAQLTTQLDKQNWDIYYKPLQGSYKYINLKKNFTFELISLVEFFKSKEFLNYLETIVGFELQIKEVSLREFTHKDFTILNDLDLYQEDRIEVLFDLSDKFEEFCGGTLTYTTKEEEVFYISPEFNSLTIMYRPQEVMSFLKYLNNNVGDKKIRRFIISYELSEE